MERKEEFDFWAIYEDFWRNFDDFGDIIEEFWRNWIVVRRLRTSINHSLLEED